MSRHVSVNRGGSFSRRPFAGANKNVYYKNGKPQYFYTSYDIKDTRYRPVLTALIVGAIFVFAGISLMNSLIVPTKLDKSYDNKIVIEDDLGILEDEAKLKATCEEFYDKTGVSLSVITVSYEEWSEKVTHYDDGTVVTMQFDSPMSYASERYEELFDDRCHILVVYTTDAGNEPELSFVPGADTYAVFTGARGFAISSELEYEMKRRSFEEAFEIAFTNAAKTASIGISDPGKFLGAAAMTVMGAYAIYIGLNLHPVRMAMCKKGYQVTTPDPFGYTKELNCPSCGGIYADKTHITCPHCGVRTDYDPSSASGSRQVFM